MKLLSVPIVLGSGSVFWPKCQPVGRTFRNSGLRFRQNPWVLGRGFNKNASPWVKVFEFWGQNQPKIIDFLAKHLEMIGKLCRLYAF